MSDTTQPSAPPPSAPAPVTTTTEVPVVETPVTTPSPIGEQAPPKPPGQTSDKSSHIGRREALQNAFARAKQAQDEAAKAPPRAKPGMGHNQPPEAMSKEAQQVADKTEKTGQPSEKQQRYREGGKFARDPAKAVQPQPAEAAQPQPQPQPGEQPQPIKQLDERAPYREPPGRFSESAKAEWHAAPESVRGAVHHMAREFQGAYEKFRGDHDVMNQLRPYHDLATKQGTSLRRAFDNYYGMETKLRGDLVGGLDVIVQNMKMRHGDGSPVTLRDVAHHIVNMSPEQHQLTAQRNQQSSSDQRIGQLHQQVDQLTQGINQMMYQQRFTQTRSQVDQFAEAHPRFDELSDLIKSELDLGFPLEVAYQRADKLRPNTQAAQTRNTPAQTRKTSISGAPDGSGKAASTRPSDGQRRNGEAKHPTRREAIAKAIRRVGNGV